MRGRWHRFRWHRFHLLRFRLLRFRRLEIQQTLLAAATACSLGACADLTEYDRSSLDRALADSLVATNESWDPELALMEDDRVLLRIRGSHAVTWQQVDRRETRIDGPVQVELLDTLGRPTTLATSKTAVYDAKNGQFELLDSVRVVSSHPDGDRYLRTEYLFWSSEADRISSPRLVTIITPTDSLTGTEFESTTDLTSYTILSPRGRSQVD